MLKKKMEFKRFSWKYINCFFLLGQSPYYSKLASTEKSLLMYFPSIFYLMCVTVAYIYFIDVKINQKINFKFSMYSVHRLILLINCVTVTKCSPLFRNSLKKMWRIFENLEFYSGQTLQLQWSYKQCNRMVLMKFIIVILLYSFRVATKAAKNDILSAIFSNSILAMTFANSLHGLFYLETFHFMMKTINDGISKSAKSAKESNDVFNLENNYTERVCAEIEVYKNIHYKMWQITTLINDNFGWMFVGFFLQMMINIWNLITWFIIDIHENSFSTQHQFIGMTNIHFF